MRHINIMILASAMTLASCGESFFDLTPDYEVAVDAVYKTKSDFNIAVMGCYAKLQTQMKVYSECCEYRSDNLSLNAPTAGTQDRYDIDHFTDKGSNGILQDLWANFDNAVYRCNLVLDRIDGASFDEADKKQYKGEALFIRALNYFNMYRLWGPVPITNHVVTVDEALTVGRGTDEDMRAMIEGDLQQIVSQDLLPASYDSKNVGRATMGAAKALLAKVYLTFKQPKEAAETLASIIGTYQLEHNVADVFDVNNKQSKEIVFSIRFNKEVVGEGHGAWYNLVNLTDDTNQTATLRNLYTDGDARKALIEYVAVPGVKVCVMRKFYDTPDATTNTYGNDFIFLRYADVLLMQAEALNEQGYNASSSSPALKALNEVHTRAGLEPIDISEVPDQASFRKAIMLERQKEFPYEGQRWFDAVRLGGAIEAAAAEGHTIAQWQELYPIPTTELERINNPKLLWQNPGY